VILITRADAVLEKGQIQAGFGTELQPPNGLNTQDGLSRCMPM